MESINITAKMFVLCRFLSQKAQKDMVYYVKSVTKQSSVTTHYHLEAKTQFGITIIEKSNIRKLQLLPFWLQMDMIYTFIEERVRIYDIVPDNDGAMIIYYKSNGNSKLLSVYYPTFMAEHTELLSITEA